MPTLAGQEHFESIYCQNQQNKCCMNDKLVLNGNQSSFLEQPEKKNSIRQTEKKSQRVIRPALTKLSLAKSQMCGIFFTYKYV